MKILLDSNDISFSFEIRNWRYKFTQLELVVEHLESLGEKYRDKNGNLCVKDIQIYKDMFNIPQLLFVIEKHNENN